MRFHGGFQYAHIKPGITFSNTTNITSINGVQESQYNGFGPRTGLDMTYVFGNGFGVYAKGAAVLVGTSKFKTTALTHLNVRDRNRNALADGSKTAVVPELEAKLGANYTYSMAQGDLMLDAGYMWFNYFNAYNAYPYTSGFTLDARVAKSDYSANGPYFGLKYVGNI